MRKCIREILLSILFCSMFTVLSSYAKGNFEVVGETTLPHSASYKLTKLKDGRILISDFDQAYTNLSKPVPENERFFKNFEIYNPKTKKFTKISQPKIWHTYSTKPIVLDDGNVLLVGSYCHMSPLKKDVTPFQLNMCTESQYAEVYDPITDTYKTVGKLQVPRAQFGIVKLNNGNVLITNGISQYVNEYDKNGKIDYYKTDKNKLKTRFSELYNPETETFTLNSETSVDKRRKYVKVGDESYEYDYYINNIKNKPKPVYPVGDLRNKLPIPKETIYEVSQSDISEETIRLDNGNVLVLWLNHNAAEIFNSTTNTFRRISDLNKNRDSSFPAAMVHKLLDGRVAVIGGSSQEARNSVEIFEPKTEKFYDGGTIPILGKGHLSILTSNGKILIYGGILNNNSILKGYYYIHSMILYDPITNTTEIIDESPKQYNLGRAILLDDGSIFFLASVKGKGRGVIYRNEKLMRSNL